MVVVVVSIAFFVWSCMKNGKQRIFIFVRTMYWFLGLKLMAAMETRKKKNDINLAA